MELEPIGRIDDVDDLDLDPIVVPIVGYTMDREEVIEKFKFKPMAPAGATLGILRSTQSNGTIPIGPVMLWLDKCLLDEAELERWTEHLNNDQVMIESTVLVDTYRALTEAYTARPTRPPSGSPSGGPRTRRTSPAARRSRASG